jgi:hypothetical protein
MISMTINDFKFLGHKDSYNKDPSMKGGGGALGIVLLPLQIPTPPTGATRPFG